VTDVMSPGPNKKDAVPIDVLRVAPAIFRRWVFRCCAAATLLFRGRRKERCDNHQRALAKRLWKNQDPLGRRISFHEEKVGTEIIGVVKTGKYRTLGEDPIPVATWLNCREAHTGGAHVRYPAALLDTVRREIHSVDSHIAATDLETMQQYMTLPLFPARTTGVLLGYPDSWRWR